MNLDHLVILVRELKSAVEDYEELGFTVTPGGEHADGLTRNALIPFSDGTYLELVAFTDPQDTRDNVWGWRAFAVSGGGLIDHCLTSGELSRDVRRLREAGLSVDGPDEGGRRLPDGSEIRWSSARVRQRGRSLPFLIEDLTPKDKRVPDAVHHPNGASGIARLRISASDSDIDAYASLIATPEPDGTLRIGSCTLDLELPHPGEDAKIGPFAATLKAVAVTGELDSSLSHGASLWFG